jgi:uncharacterized protein with gpF-like domain
VHSRLKDKSVSRQIDKKKNKKKKKLSHYKNFYSSYFPQLAAVVQPLLLRALQNLTAILLKIAANHLQRFL